MQKNETINWIATAFLYGEFKEQVDDQISKYDTFLVTNKHVLKNQIEIILRLKTIENNKIIEYPLQLVIEDKEIWHGHPSNLIDIAIIRINGGKLQEDGIKFFIFKSDRNILLKTEMIESGISLGDEIFLLGYPMGLVDLDSPVPVVRQGIIASMQNPMIKEYFLIDSQNYPGNSGGPVIYKPNINFIEGTKNYTKSRLIGVVNSYIMYNDVAVSLQTRQQVLILSQNSGLANVIPVDYINETIIDYHSKNK